LPVAAPPFARLHPVPADGHGLNPLLEDTGMITHPVALYLGFTGLTVPFAFAMAALISGRVGDAWLTMTRRWTIVAWYFLSLGLLIGGWLSYHVLGWGGYWAWCSVENAALMPCLIATALLDTVFFGTVFPLLSEALRGVKVSVGAPFFNQVNVPLFLGLIFLMGVGPLIAWRRASVDNLRRNFLGPVLTGVAAAAFFFALGVHSALAVLTLALTVFVAATIALDFARATRVRARMGEPLLPAMGGLLRLRTL